MRLATRFMTWLLAGMLPASLISAAEFSVKPVAVSEMRLLENRGGEWLAPHPRTGRAVPGLMQLLTLGLLRDEKARQLLSLTLRARYTGNWASVCGYGDIKVTSASDDRGADLELIKAPADGGMSRLRPAMLKREGAVSYLDIPLVFEASNRAAGWLAKLRLSMSFRTCERVRLDVALPAGRADLRHADLKAAGLQVRYSPPDPGPFTFPDMPRVSVQVEGRIENFAGARLLQKNGKPLYVREDSGPTVVAGAARLTQSITLWKLLPEGVTLELEVESGHARRQLDLFFQDIPLP